MQAHATARAPGDDPEMPSHAQTALIPMPSGRGVRGSTGASLGLGRGPGGRPRAVYAAGACAEGRSTSFVGAGS